MKVGDRIGVRQIEDKLLHIGNVHEISIDTGIIYGRTDAGTSFIGVPNYDEIKPVYRWSKIRGEKQ